ncbi:MAG: arginine N-succinyltransferase [Maricaulaceae bacterium]
MLIARPATLKDGPALIELAKQAGPGFTSLAVSEDALLSRLKRSIATFGSPSGRRPDDIYMLMLEDLETEKVVGLSAVKAMIGIKDPFFNFRILKIAQNSNVVARRFDMDVLIMVNDYGGSTEVGSLFVSADSRGTGAGRLISQSRYMLMATEPERFGDQVISELRGHVEPDGTAPFWEAIGRKFFQMDFKEADQISASKDNQFIIDLMPKHPIYVELLAEEAKSVIAQTHPEGVGARRLLEKEGFRFDGVIDIFDAGPLVSCPRHDLETIKTSRHVKVIAQDKISDSCGKALISNDRLSDFRSIVAPFKWSNSDIMISRGAYDALKISDNHIVRICEL